MEILTGPKHEGGGRRLLGIAALLVAAVVAAAVALWLLRRPPAGEPKGPPPLPRARTSPSPRATPAPAVGPEARAVRPRAEARAEASRPVLRVDSDVPGATVFLDRKFLGKTPLETRDFEPGSHRLNVSAEGYEMYGEPVELAAGPNEVVVRFKEVRLDERIDVVHKHGIGSCRGRLVATTAGLRFEADKASDSFEAPFASLEPLEVDYLDKNLRLKLRRGRTWNFTAESRDSLLAFQKAVEGARKRM